MNEKQYIISESILSALMAYLQKRPYAEVAHGIAALSQLPELTLEEPGKDGGQEGLPDA